MFDENSGLVKTWVDLIRREQYTTNDVPNLSNLRTVVANIINQNGGEN